MDNKLIIFMAFLIVVAGVGGYFVGLYQGAGTLSLNLSNNSTGNVSNSTTTHKTTTVTPTKNTTPVTNNTPKNTTNSS